MRFPNKIVPCLWFDGRAEEAARFYAGIFPGGRIVEISHYPEVGREVHGHAAGAVLTVEFELAGQRFTALNGGPHFKFNEALSLQVMVDSQEELDTYWSALSAVPEAEQCGWLKDKFGVSWQVTPKALDEMMSKGTPEQIARVTQAFLPMKKFDIATLEAAYQGK